MAIDPYKVPELKYAPAKRQPSNALLMIAGTWGTGKTYSALRLATGLAEGGEIDVADTENGRALYYADRFKFNHCLIKEPFRPEVFEAAAVLAQKRGSRVWICDNFSWEHIGPGGLLMWHSKEVERMTKGDWSKAEAMNAAAWIAPKAAHTMLLQRLWQLNMHVILVCQAKNKLVITRDEKTGKQKWTNTGWTPVVSDDLGYAMVTSLMLQPETPPGVPSILKHQEDLDPLIPTDRPLSEDVGRAIAAWCRGETPTLTAKPRESAEPPQTRGGERQGRTQSVAMELIEKFKATKVRADHFDLVDDPDVRKRLDWLRINRIELYNQINDAMSASWERTESPDQPDEPTDDGEPPVDQFPDDDFPGDPNYKPPATLQKQEELL